MRMSNTLLLSSPQTNYTVSPRQPSPLQQFQSFPKVQQQMNKDKCHLSKKNVRSKVGVYKMLWNILHCIQNVRLMKHTCNSFYFKTDRFPCWILYLKQEVLWSPSEPFLHIQYMKYYRYMRIISNIGRKGFVLARHNVQGWSTLLNLTVYISYNI